MLTARLLRNDRELEEAFRLRFDTYRDSRLRDFVHPQGEGRDSDEYDSSAYHLGLFAAKDGIPKLMGYMRLIRPAKPSLPLPCMQYFTDALSVIGRERVIEYVEGSRFVIAAQWRRADTARRMVLAAMAFMKYKHLRYALIACRPAHAAFYLDLGFTKLAVKQAQVNSVIGNLMHLDASALSSRYRDEVLEYLESWQIDGFVPFPLGPAPSMSELVTNTSER